MTIIEKIKLFLYPDSSQEFYRNNGIFIGVFLLCILVVGAYSYGVQNSLLSSIKKINASREQARVLLQKMQRVEQQHAHVDALLAEEPIFKLQSFYDDTRNRLGLAAAQKKDPEIARDPRTPLYEEVRLTASLRQITMKQLCDLLEAIEQKERIYVKELTISQQAAAQPIDVTLVLATLIESGVGATSHSRYL